MHKKVECVNGSVELKDGTVHIINKARDAEIPFNEIRLIKYNPPTEAEDGKLDLHTVNNGNNRLLFKDCQKYDILKIYGHVNIHIAEINHQYNANKLGIAFILACVGVVLLAIFSQANIAAALFILGAIACLILRHKSKKKITAAKQHLALAFQEEEELLLEKEREKDTCTKIIENSEDPKVVNEGTVTVPGIIQGMPLSYRYQNVKIAIIRGEDPDYSAISPGDMITLIQEPSNKYDSNAVIVMANDIKLGYLYKGALQEIANRFLKLELPIFSCISAIEDDARTIEIFLGFYQDDYSAYKYYLDGGSPHKKFKLVSNLNEEMQDAISNLYWPDNYKGTKVFLHYDYDKDKYYVSDVNDIGYMPKSAHQYIEDGNLDTAFIESIVENDNDKYEVVVLLPLS